MTELVYHLHPRTLCDTFTYTDTFSCTGKVQSATVYVLFYW